MVKQTKPFILLVLRSKIIVGIEEYNEFHLLFHPSKISGSCVFFVIVITVVVVFVVVF